MSCVPISRRLSPGEVASLRLDAWIGDAVLELYARCRIVDEEHQRNAARLIRFVRNSSLNRLGQPTRVEAEIGRCYASGGLDAAFAWIREHIEPAIVKQEADLKRVQKPAPKRRTQPGSRREKS